MARADGLQLYRDRYVLHAAESLGTEQGLRHEHWGETGEGLMEQSDCGCLWRWLGRGRGRESMEQSDCSCRSAPAQERPSSRPVECSPVHWSSL